MTTSAFERSLCGRRFRVLGVSSRCEGIRLGHKRAERRLYVRPSPPQRRTDHSLWYGLLLLTESGVHMESACCRYGRPASASLVQITELLATGRPRSSMAPSLHAEKV